MHSVVLAHACALNLPRWSLLCVLRWEQGLPGVSGSIFTLVKTHQIVRASFRMNGKPLSGSMTFFERVSWLIDTGVRP
ncbi:hypothetical protein WJX79_005072 [Trebouxia sp. C0005]